MKRTFPPLFLFLALAIVTLEWLAQFNGKSWSWDVDHFLYFGQRLLEGELHWTVEFDDKLPVNQLIFILPALFESRHAWMLMSTGSILLCAGAVYVIVTQTLNRHVDMDRGICRRAGYVGATAAAFSFVFLFPGIHTVNAMAASCLTLAIACLIVAQKNTGDSTRVMTGLFVASAALASLALGLRPYYGLVAITLPFWVCLRFAAPVQTYQRKLLTMVYWFMLVGAFGLLANVVPYLLTGQFGVFLDGLRALGEELVAQDLYTNIRWQINGFLERVETPVQMIFLCMLIAAASAFAALVFPNRTPLDMPRGFWIDTVYLLAVIPALIEAMFLAKHFWIHYFQLLVPFAAIGTAFFYVIVARTLARVEAPDLERLLRLSLGLILLVFMAPLGLRGVSDISDNAEKFPAQEAQAEQIRAFIDQRPAEARDFLVPEDMFVHFYLTEPRHGFPHAANTDFITVGYWADLTLPERFGLPNTVAAFCAKLEAEGPSVIFLKTNEAMKRCLDTSSVYQPLEPAAGTLPESLFIGVYERSG